MEVNNIFINKSMNSPRSLNQISFPKTEKEKIDKKSKENSEEDNKPDNEADDKIKQLMAQNEKLEKECLKFKIQLKSMETKVQEASEKNYKSTTNTSSKFILPSEFKQLWESLAQENIMDTFIDFIDNQQLAYYLINEFFLINIRFFKDNFLQKIRKIFEHFKIPNSQSSLSSIIKFFRPLIEEFYDSIFYDPEETEAYCKTIGNTILTKLKERNLLDEEDSVYEELIECLDGRYFKEFINKMKKIILYCEMHEPPLQFSLETESGSIENPKIRQFKSAEIICIDGLPNENKKCLVLIEPPYLKKNFYYMSLKPIVVVYKKGVFPLFENEVEIKESDKSYNKSHNFDNINDTITNIEQANLSQRERKHSQTIEEKTNNKAKEICINTENPFFSQDNEVKETPKAEFIKLKAKSEYTYSTPNFKQDDNILDKADKSKEEKFSKNLIKEKLFEKIIESKDSSRNKTSVQKYETAINSFSNLSMQLAYNNSNFNNHLMTPSVNVNANLSNLRINNNTNSNSSSSKLISSSVSHLKIDKLDNESSIGPFSQGTKKTESSVSVNVKLNMNPNTAASNSNSFPFTNMTNTNKKSRQKINHPTYINSFKDKAKVITTSQIYKNKTINNEYQTGEDKDDSTAKNIKLQTGIDKSKKSPSNCSTPNTTVIPTSAVNESKTNAPLQTHTKQIMIKVKETNVFNKTQSKPVQIKQINYNENTNNSLNKTHSYKNNSNSNCSNIINETDQGLSLKKRQSSIDNDKLIEYLNIENQSSKDPLAQSTLVTPKNRENKNKTEVLMNSFKKNFSFNNGIIISKDNKETSSPKHNYLSQMKKSKTKTYFESTESIEKMDKLERSEKERIKKTIVSTDVLYKLIHLNYNNQIESSIKRDNNTTTNINTNSSSNNKNNDFRSTSHHNLLYNRKSTYNPKYKSNVSYDDTNPNNKKQSAFINQIKSKKNIDNLFNNSSRGVFLETAGNISDKRSLGQALIERSDVPLKTEVVERRTNLNLNSFESNNVDKGKRNANTSSKVMKDNTDSSIMNKIDCETINYNETLDNNMLINEKQVLTDKFKSDFFFHEKKTSEGSGFNFKKENSTMMSASYKNKNTVNVNTNINNYKAAKVIKGIQSIHDSKQKKDDKVVIVHNNNYAKYHSNNSNNPTNFSQNQHPHQNQKISNFTHSSTTSQQGSQQITNHNSNLSTQGPKRISTSKRKVNTSSFKTEHQGKEVKASSKMKNTQYTNDSIKIKQTKIIHSIKNYKNKESNIINNPNSKFTESCGFNNAKPNLNNSSLIITENQIQYSQRERDNIPHSNHHTIDNEKDDINSLIKETTYQTHQYSIVRGSYTQNFNQRQNSKTPKQIKMKETFPSNTKTSQDISPQHSAKAHTNFPSREKVVGKHNVNLKRYTSHSKDLSDHNLSQQASSNHKFSSQKIKELDEMRKLCSSLSKERKTPTLSNNIMSKEFESKIPQSTLNKFNHNSSTQGVNDDVIGLAVSNQTVKTSQSNYIQNLHSNMNLRKASFSSSMVGSSTSKQQGGSKIQIQNCSTPTTNQPSTQLTQNDKKPSKGLFGGAVSGYNTNIIKVINKNDSKGRISPNYFGKK